MQTGSTHQIGRKGEHLATEYLQNKGFQILHQNYRYSRREIDIIAQSDNLIIFVEVKLRKNTRFGFPEQTVNAQKQHNIRTVASHFLHLNTWKGNIRFDIIAIIKDQTSFEILHIEDAFA